MDLCNYETVKKILSKHGFTFSKSLGQNFIIDSSVCPNMAECLEADKETGVIEIGPGIGVLTKELSKVAGKVITIELDKRLFPVLDETLAECDNVEIIEGDALKLDLNSLIKEKFPEMKKVKVCANLPYYITSPIIMMLLMSDLPISDMVLMVQKEAAERLCAEIGSKECGAVSVAVNYRAKSEILFEVLRTSYMPAPKVDSAVIRLSLRVKPSVEVKNEKHFFAVVKAAFAQRRKTALNSLSSGLGVSKEEVEVALKTLGVDERIRPEKFTMEQFAKLSELL